jgi:sorbitol/mannitol transport system substrate-binding protein
MGGVTLDALKTIDPDHATKLPVPYTGIQYVQIPEFQDLGTRVAQQFAAVLAGNKPLDAAPQERPGPTRGGRRKRIQGLKGAFTWQPP